MQSTCCTAKVYQSVICLIADSGDCSRTCAHCAIRSISGCVSDDIYDTLSLVPRAPTHAFARTLVCHDPSVYQIYHSSQRHHMIARDDVVENISIHPFPFCHSASHPVGIDAKVLRWPVLVTTY